MIAIMILALTPTRTAKGVDTDCVLTKEANDNGKKKKKLPFTEGLRAVAMVRTGEQWDYIDKSGKIVIPLEYDDVSNFNDGHAFVKKDGRLGLIDSLGNITHDYEVMKEYILPYSWADSEPKFNGEGKDSFAL